MGDGFAALDRQLARLRALPSMVDRAAPAIVASVDAELRASIARGQSPDGVAWKLTKDGREPLKNAAKALSVERVGHAIVATVEGVEARHSNGWVRGGIARPMLPKKMTAPLANAIDGALTQEFKRTMGGGR
jgi:hypothetical protein